LDQASFRRVFLSYKHYQFRGDWELKDQGAVEAGPGTVRELFLVLQDDLIEFKIADPNPHTRIEVRNMGYIKKGCLPELQQWLAYQTFLEKPESAQPRGSESAQRCESGPANYPPRCRAPGGFLSGIFSLGRAAGVLFFP
jgi:hypothetical protein